MEEQSLISKEEEETEEAEKNRDGKSRPYPVWDCGSPLYDSFELASLCHVLDRHIMKLPYLPSLRSPAGRFEPGGTQGMIAEAVSVRRCKMKREAPPKRRSAFGLTAFFRAVAFWKKLKNDK
ncbi:hypothetical protein KSP39_PZI019932 [Platanthera zijinensis]|uniref:Uncharacterized protein n=1 Tax=Platanthera zijinensis TaxID=2320716 RepID=A0AAP0AZ89_9ASPA